MARIKNKYNNKKLKSGRGPVGKQAAIDARERGSNVKAQAISNTETLKGFAHGHVKSGSTVFMDDHRGDLGRGGTFYDHASFKHSAKKHINVMTHTNEIESVWTLLRRGYTGTFHHFTLTHLRRYADKLAFRLNEGNCKRNAIIRIQSVCTASAGKRLTYKNLVS